MTVRKGRVALLIGVGLSVAAVAASVAVADNGSSARPRHTAGSAASAAPSAARGGSTAGSTVRTVAAVGLSSHSIPGTTSHFRARPALVWVPPAARSHPSLRFPVLELLIGTPGAPSNWTNQGRLLQTMSAVAAKHGGRAPIVVVVDENGTVKADTECVDKRTGDVEKYLTVDVPRWIRAHLPVASGRNNFAVGGLSEGGTCALMLALRSPSVWSTFDDISGLVRPTVGSDDNRAQTIRVLFGGSVAAFDAHDPTLLLRRHTYPTTRGELYWGRGDAKIVRDVKILRPLLSGARVSTRAVSRTGKHDWTVFSSGLASFVNWWYRG